MRFPCIAMALCAATFACSPLAYAGDAYAGDAHAGDAQTSAPANQAEHSAAAYIPGMGEIMGATQMRHAKLWFAGKARNWELASYEVDEIEEGLADAVKYHPVFKKDAPVAAMLDRYTKQPLDDIRRAIAAHNGAKFVKAFDTLTGACNGCHEAAGQGFIVLKRPAGLPYSNQEFAIKAR